MGLLVFIVGKSGMGKSTSLRNLNPDETVIINADQKALPFRKFSENYNSEKKNYRKTSNIKTINDTLTIVNGKPEVKNIVLDTVSHVMTDYIMSTEFRSTKGFDKWGIFAGQIYDLINTINEKLRDDIIVYVFAHPETIVGEMGDVVERIAVQGKQLEKMGPESFSTVVLYAEILKVQGEPNRHVFRTKSSGNDTCKTPLEMFDTDVIDNDLTIVSTAIREYYGI